VTSFMNDPNYVFGCYLLITLVVDIEIGVYLGIDSSAWPHLIG